MKSEIEIRNEALEEAAKRLELCAGEGLQDGKTFHYCAKRVRDLKRERTELKLEWVRRDEQTIRGFLVGHPETTLFLIQRVYRGKHSLRGAFVPDAYEGELWGFEEAQDAALSYMLAWVHMIKKRVFECSDLKVDGGKVNGKAEGERLKAEVGNGTDETEVTEAKNGTQGTEVTEAVGAEAARTTGEGNIDTKLTALVTEVKNGCAMLNDDDPRHEWHPRARTLGGWVDVCVNCGRRRNVIKE